MAGRAMSAIVLNSGYFLEFHSSVIDKLLSMQRAARVPALSLWRRSLSMGALMAPLAQRKANGSCDANEATQLRLNEAKQLGVKTLEPTLKAQQIENRSPADRWGRIATYSVQIATEGDDRFVWPSIRATRNCGADEQRALTCSGQAPTATKLQR